MPKQRGGWKGKPENRSSSSLAGAPRGGSSSQSRPQTQARQPSRANVASGSFGRGSRNISAGFSKGGAQRGQRYSGGSALPADMYDEVDAFHGDDDEDASDADQHAARTRDDELDVEPVLDIQGDDDDDDDEGDNDDEDEDDEGGDAEGDEDEQDDGHQDGEADDDDDDDADDDDDELSQDDDVDAEADARARAREDALVREWGRGRAAYHDGDADVEVDEEAAALEEEEVKRMQKARAAAMEDDDLTFGLGGPVDASVPSRTGTPSVAKRSRDGASGATVKARMDALAADAPEIVGMLEDLRDRVSEVRGTLAPILEAAAAGRLPTSDGLAYCEARNSVLMAYTTDIAFFMLLKAEGRSVRDHPVVEELLRLRVLLEKMRPLDAKMQPTITRLLAQARTSTSGGVAGAAKPRPDALLAHGAEDADDHEAEADGVYRPLHRTAVRYDDDAAAAKAARERARKQAQIARSALYADLKAEFDEAPEEAAADGFGKDASRTSGLDRKLARIEADRSQYEEEHMTRLQMSKEEKKARAARQREAARWDALAELENFGDLDALLDDAAPADSVRSGAAARARQRSEAALAAGKRGRAEPEDVPADSEDDADALAEYEQAAAEQAHKKSKRAARYAEAEAETRAVIQARVDSDEEVDETGARSASKDIIRNKGLVKYRKASDKNPRVAYRRKAEKAAKARSGQVVPLRSRTATNVHAYEGEDTGVRTTVTHSRRIR